MLFDGYAMAMGGDPYDGIFALQDLAPQGAPSLLLARPGRHEGLTELPHAHPLRRKREESVAGRGLGLPEGLQRLADVVEAVRVVEGQLRGSERVLRREPRHERGVLLHLPDVGANRRGVLLRRRVRAALLAVLRRPAGRARVRVRGRVRLAVRLRP